MSKDLFWFDSRGSGNHYEADDGYQEAAPSLQASASEAEANYAQVDMTKKKKNRRPPADEYAQVDKSKKTKKRPKVTMTSREVLCHYCCTFGGTYFFFLAFISHFPPHTLSSSLRTTLLIHSDSLIPTLFLFSCWVREG